MITQHRCWVFGDNVTTDDIFPQRYVLKAVAHVELASHIFEDIDPLLAGQVQSGDVIVAGENWGCGSCRDQAVTALKAAGISAIVAASFNNLYFRNCVSFGIVPVVLPELRELVTSGDWLWLDRTRRFVIAKGQVFVYPGLSEAGQAVPNAGGVVPMIERHDLTTGRHV